MSTSDLNMYCLTLYYMLFYNNLKKFLSNRQVYPSNDRAACCLTSTIVVSDLFVRRLTFKYKIIRCFRNYIVS